MTLFTGGAAAIVGAGLLFGAGSSLVTAPVAKKIQGEAMTAGDLATDVAIGATVGVASGGIGSGASALTKGATGLVKFAARAGAGAAAGALGGSIQETGRTIAEGEELDKARLLKAMAVGTIAGGVGGAATHVGSNASKLVSNGAGKVVTRVTVQATASGIAATGVELYENDGELDADSIKRIGLAAGSQAAVAATYECAANGIARTEAYSKKMGGGDVKTVANDPEFQRKKADYEQTQERLKMYKDAKTRSLEIGQRNDLTPQEKQQLREQLPAKGKIARINQRIGRAQSQLRDPGMQGDRQNVHLLKGERAGQFAVDLEPVAPGKPRGPERAVFDVRDGEARYVGQTLEHDYGNLQAHSETNSRPHLDAAGAITQKYEMEKDDDDDKKNK